MPDNNTPNEEQNLQVQEIFLTKKGSLGPNSLVDSVLIESKTYKIVKGSFLLLGIVTAGISPAFMIQFKQIKYGNTVTVGIPVKSYELT